MFQPTCSPTILNARRARHSLTNHSPYSPRSSTYISSSSTNKPSIVIDPLTSPHTSTMPSSTSPRIISVDTITPSINSYPPPGPTVRLSFLDTSWIHLPYMQPLYLYPNPATPLPSIVASLKSSLSQTLKLFHPLSGKFVLSGSDDVVIDCTHGNCGVQFVEAECDWDIERLAGDEIHDSEKFIELVPEIDMTALPLPTLAVKVTRFASGGVSVGLAIHHAVMDGNGVMRFLETWAAKCRADEEAVGAAALLHDRKVIVHPRDQEIARLFLKKKAPHLPKVATFPLTVADRLRLQRRTFHLSSSDLQSLKQSIIKQSNGSNNPSTFTTISAYAWACMARANLTGSNPSTEVTNLLFLIDLRSCLNPPLPATYTGNCVRSCNATATWVELLGPQGMSHAEEMITRAVKEGRRDPLEGCEHWPENFKRIPQTGRVLITGSPRFHSAQTDFGWGEPRRMELVSMNLDGEVVLDGKSDGSVQVSVALDQIRMGSFTEAFVNGLNRHL